MCGFNIPGCCLKGLPSIPIPWDDRTSWRVRSLWRSPWLPQWSASRKLGGDGDFPGIYHLVMGYIAMAMETLGNHGKFIDHLPINIVMLRTKLRYNRCFNFILQHFTNNIMFTNKHPDLASQNCELPNEHGRFWFYPPTPRMQCYSLGGANPRKPCGIPREPNKGLTNDNSG